LNSSDSERFERAYRRVWGALHRGDDPELSQHERQLLHHVPAEGGIALNALAAHLALPKSTASVVVKDLERRGFVRRRRDARDERRLAIVLTAEGQRRVAADTVLEPAALARALAGLPEDRRAVLLDGVEALAGAAELQG
jgi:DNA-binding MarR family transcriptional regulator